MTTFLERLRDVVEPIAARLRESPRAMLAALAAVLAVGLLVGRWTSPAPSREPVPVAEAPAPKATDFESLVAGDSPFETSRQGEQKRLVALQNTLATAIAGFDGVERASVFIAPRAPTAGLGASASSRSASVHLTMDAGRRLDDGQVAAIARLVAGAETGLRPDSVAIVDGSGPRATPAAGVGPAVPADLARRVRERLATLLPEGTVPEVSVTARPVAEGPAALDVAIAIPHAYFVAAHALAGEDPGELAAFRAAEAERLAAATGESLAASLDPDAFRLAACRVDWTFTSGPPLVSDVFPAGLPWVRVAVLGSLGLAIALAVAVPVVRARRRPATADSIAALAVEAKPAADPGPADLEPIVRGDPAEAAEAIERWVRGGAA